MPAAKGQRTHTLTNTPSKLDAPRCYRGTADAHCIARTVRPIMSCKDLLERCCRCFRGPPSKEAALQAQLAADKAAMVSRHQRQEKLEKASTSNAVVRFGKAAGRKTEYMLFLCKEYALNTPGCATGRSGLERAASGLETVKAKTVDGAGMAKAQAMKVLQPDKVKK